MVGDVVAAAGLVDVDVARRQRVGGRENVPASAVAAHAERQDVGMFEEQEGIANDAGPALLDQRSLESERISVRNAAQPPHIESACRLPVVPLQPVPPS